MSDARRSRRGAWALLLWLAGGCASGSATAAVAAPSRAAERAEQQGLAAIAAPLIAADVAFLAARELEGRDTPSPGLRIAALYLANRLERLGFEPGAEDGWFQRWVLVEHSLDAGRTRAELDASGEPRALEYGREYAVHPAELEDADVAGELVWCGAASRADFAGLALDGRIALVEERASESRLGRRRRAAEAGAAALVVLAEPLTQESLEQRFAGWAERCREPSLHDRDREDPPVFWLAGAPAERMRELAAGLDSGAALGARFSARVEAAREVAVENVCAHWPGRDPALAREALVASAHYDHVGIQQGEIYCGADDNASGCAALLAVAEALAASGPLERPVLLLWVAGEEEGLLGAKAWTADPWLPSGAAAIANVNLDMVGRNSPALLEYTPTAEHPEHNRLSECLVRLAGLEGFTELRSADKDYARSDHAAFAAELGIPVLYVSTGEHEDYHQPSDTADKVDADKVARVARLVFRLLVEVAREGL